MGTACKLQEKLITEIQGQAACAYPEECCGILLGNGKVPDLCGDLWETYRMENVAAGETGREHFRMDPLELYRAERQAEERGMQIVGFYHSHPDHPARLSTEDEREMIPGLVCLIVSVREGFCGEIRCFIKEKLDEGAIELHTDY